MKKEFTSGQKEILARKLGYEGPMQGFESFLASSPALSAKYNMVTNKYVQRMAKGGSVRKKYVVGGDVKTDFTPLQQADIFASAEKMAAASGRTPQAELYDYAKSQGYSNDQIDQSLSAYLKPGQTQSYVDAMQANTNAALAAGPAAPAATTPAAATPALAAAPAATTPTAATPAATPPKLDLAENISATSTPAQIAAAYQQYIASAGGADTEETRAAAVKYFRSKGLLDSNIQAGYNTFTGQAPADVKSPQMVQLEKTVTDLEAKVAAATDAASKAAAQTELTQAKAALASRTTTDDQGKPVAGAAPTMTAAQITATDEQDVDTEGLAPTTAVQGKAAQAGAAQTAGAPTPITAETMTADAAAAGVQTELDKLKPATGTVTQQVKAQEQIPTTTAVGDLTAETLDKAQEVDAPDARTAQAGEMISGTGVDMTQAEALAAQTAASAAQGTVTEDMTVQGQLNKVLSNFDAGNPPPWAASTMRSAVAQMAARGLSASSMAGQAIIQAAMEAAVPIASADAKVFEQMGLQNLSNKQQTAVLAAQQRAAFLGQEFDQAFQVKVTNAAKVSDIANMNFTANQQIALENARLAQSVDLANLGNKQAVVMAEAAQIATLETTNLNNRQQAQVVNAQSFLQMDLANLDNEQQTTLFKAQANTNALLTDTAAANAAKQFNATSENQTNQFMASLTSQVNQFNAAQKNAVAQFNVDQANSIVRLNTEAQNVRDQFNSTQRLVIDQSNAQWRREISTANTAAANSANYLNAQILQAMTLAEYNNEIVLYRDQIQQAFDAFENSEERAAAILTATISGNSAKAAASTKSKGDLAVELGKWALNKWG